eukprot:scaffold179_cov368-Prasinococcus_capsulatus_cf.AAC.13
MAYCRRRGGIRVHVGATPWKTLPRPAPRRWQAREVAAAAVAGRERGWRRRPGRGMRAGGRGQVCPRDKCEAQAHLRPTHPHKAAGWQPPRRSYQAVQPTSSLRNGPANLSTVPQNELLRRGFLFLYLENELELPTALAVLSSLPPVAGSFDFAPSAQSPFAGERKLDIARAPEDERVRAADSARRG